MTIDGNRLKKDLMDYYGTASACGNPMAMVELSRVENADGEELLEIAAENGIDLSEYEI